MASTGRELTWKEDNLRVTSKLSKKAKLARQYYSTLAREQKPPARERAKTTARKRAKTTARERAKTTARTRRQQGQPEQDSQSFPACNCRRRQAPTQVLAHLSQEKESARSGTSRNRKGAPVAKPIANPHAKHLADGNLLLSVLRTQPTTPRVPSQENLHRGLLSTSRETSHPRKRLLARGKNDSNSSCSIPRRQGDNHHMETCSPSPSRSRSSSPRSNNHRSTSPSNSSHASGS